MSKFCLDFVFCRATKKRDKIENTDFKSILYSVDHYDRERQNTKYKTGNLSSFVFCILPPTRNDLSCPVFHTRRDLPRYQGDIIINLSIMNEISFVILQASVEGNSSSVNFSSHTRRV